MERWLAGTSEGHHLRGKGADGAANGEMWEQLAGRETCDCTGYEKRTIKRLVSRSCASVIVVAAVGNQAGTQPLDMAPAA